MRPEARQRGVYPQISYRTVEVSPLTKGELKWGQFKKVPVAVLDGEPLGDSSAIISRLAAEVGPGPHGSGGAAAPAASGWAPWRGKAQARPRSGSGVTVLGL